VAAEESRRPLLILFTGDPCGEKAGIGYEDDAVPGRGHQGAVSDGARARTHQTDCELLELDVLSTPEFASAAARYVPLVFHRGAKVTAGGTAADDELQRRYQVGTIPTLLLADPWGNEMLRLIGRTPKDRAVQILSAMPASFAPLRAAGEVLRQDPEDLEALRSAAAFYEAARLGPIAERYYERAAGVPAARDDDGKREDVVLSRGLNLLKMGKPREAAEAFQAEAKRSPSGPRADAVHFGWAMAWLQAGDKGRAQRISEEMRKRFPQSPYTGKLEQNLAAAR
jgi:Tfp pilus assembly protein PilF